MSAATVAALLQPVRGGIGVAVGYQLLKGHDAVAEASGDVLPVGRVELGRLLHKDDVVLTGHDLRRVVHPAQHDLAAVAVTILRRLITRAPVERNRAALQRRDLGGYALEGNRLIVPSLITP